MKTYKDNDVFDFSWSPKEEHGFDGRYHCFEGYLIYDKESNNFFDTYWHGGDNTKLNIKEIWEEVKKGGTFKYLYNLNDVIQIKESETIYYSDSDICYLSRQKGCTQLFFIKKGTKRNKAKMMKVIESRIEDVRSSIKWKNRTLELLREELEDVSKGKLKISISNI